MRKILSSVSFCVLIALIWVSCSKKDISGTITPGKLSSTTTLAAGYPTHTTGSGTTTTSTTATTSATTGATTSTTASTTGASTSATTSGSTTSSTGSTTGSTTSSTPKGMYVTAYLDGEPFSLIDKDNVYLYPVNDRYYDGSGQYFEIVFCQFNNADGAKMGFSFGELMMPNGNTLPSSTAFTTFFKVKDYNYSVDGFNDATIYYTDDNGDIYNTVNTTNSWRNSSFSVLSLKDTTYHDAGIIRTAVKMKLKFSCTVESDKGNKLNFTNGQATLLFVNK